MSSSALVPEFSDEMALEKSAAYSPVRSTEAPSREGNEFEYRALPILAPITFFLGLLSLIAWVGVSGLAICVIGLAVGAVAWHQIRNSEGQFGGMKLVLSGMALNVVCLLGGSASHYYAFVTEVPEGFRRISFSQDIAKKNFVVQDGIPSIHPDVQSLEGEKIFVKGYMYPTRTTEGLTAFILVKDNGQCCFGGQPAITDMILVKMKPGKTVDFEPILVSVAGTFKQRDLSQAGNLSPVYELEGEFFSAAKTSF